MNIKNKILSDGFINCKDILKGKKVILLSCGPSIEKYKNLINIKDKENTIIVAIKTATDYSKGNEDFFFYDERVYRGIRNKFKYQLNSKSIKILCKNYVEHEDIDTNIKHDLALCLTKNPPGFFINYEDIKFTANNNIKKIFSNFHYFFPIFLKALLFMEYLGVKDFDIFGVNWYNEDISPQLKHFLNHKPRRILFDNLMGSFFSNIFLKNIIKKRKLNVKLYSEYSQVDISIPRLNLDKTVFFQKSNFYYDNLNSIQNNNTENNYYYKLLELCSKSKYINCKWYKTLLLMISKMETFKLDKINNFNDKYLNNNPYTSFCSDYIYAIGYEIGM